MRYLDENPQQQVITETDSLLMKNVILKIWEVPWHIMEEVEEIWKRMNGRTINITHIMREGNQLANYLTNVALEEGEVNVESFQELDVKGRRLINNDKLKSPLFEDPDMQNMIEKEISWRMATVFHEQILF